MKKKRKQGQEKIRVMLVDDHEGLRDALRKVINLQPDLEVVAEANGGGAALQLVPRINPDIVLMDGSMPEMNGIETTRRLKQIQPQTKVIGLTLYGETTYLEEMVAVGASGYLVKTGSPENMFNAIRVVSEGGTYFDSAVPRYAAPAAPVNSATAELTADELAVTKRLAQGQTNSEIASALGMKKPVVESHRTVAMRKLGLQSRAGLVRLATERHWFDA